MQNFTAILNLKMALCILVVCVPRAAIAAEDTSITPIPFVANESDGLFLQGIEGGCHITASAEEKKAVFFQDVVGNGRFRAGEIRQKFTVEFGLRVGVRRDFRVFDVTFLQDVTGTSNDQEVIGAYSDTFHDRRYKWIFTSQVGGSCMSRKMVNYVWGVTGNQHNKIVADNLENSDKPVLPVYEREYRILINYRIRLFEFFSFSLGVITVLDISG